MLFLWIAIILTAIVIDIVSAQFMLFSFSIGGLIALILDLSGVSEVIQIIAFLVVSVICIFTLVPVFKKYIKATATEYKERENTYIGSSHRVVLTETSKCVKIDGALWRIKSEDVLQDGNEVEVVSVEGNTLVVKLKKNQNILN